VLGSPAIVSLRYRTALATIVSVMLIMATLLLAYRFIVREAFSELQDEEAREDLVRARSVLLSELRSLDVLLVDWASWDDMYEFVETRSPAFVSSNLPPDILAMMHLNALVIRDASGNNIIGLGQDGEDESVTVRGLTDTIAGDSPLLAYGSEGRLTGIYSTPLGAMLLASRPVLRSDGTGAARGNVIMARLLDDRFAERLTDMLAQQVAILPLESTSVPDEIRASLQRATPEAIVTDNLQRAHLCAYSYLYDVRGAPVAILVTATERNLEAQSGRTLWAVLITVGLTGVVLVAALVLIIDITVVRRLRHLHEEMNSITGRGSSEGLRTHVSGRDEIGDLASGVNAMLDRLEAAAAARLRLEQTVSEQERLAEEAFRAVDEGLIVVDGEDCCTASNPAALRILNLTAAELIGQPLSEVLPLLRPADDVTRSAGPQFFEIGRRSVAVSRSSGQTPGRLSVVALRDITDVREVERLKRDLVATVSHELRTPLTAIQATVSMLHAGDGGELTDLQRRLVGLLDRNTDRLRTLVDDLLDLGALEGGRVSLVLKPVDLAALCSGIVEENSAAAASGDVTFRTDLASANVAADPSRIHQVVQNLVQNAIKFTRPGGTVEVSTEQDEAGATIRVRDSGIGIPPAELDRIFEKFYRTNEGARFAQGTGLGLSIARSIVTLHGGAITAESDGSSGTTITVRLPLSPPPPVLERDE